MRYIPDYGDVAISQDASNIHLLINSVNLEKKMLEFQIVLILSGK